MSSGALNTSALNTVVLNGTTGSYAFTYIAAGFVSTSFGAPKIAPGQALGFCGTVFGLPNIPPGFASGFSSTAFGAANSHAVVSATGTSLPPTVVFGSAYGSTYFPLVGFSSTTFGLAHVVPGWVPGFLATHMGDIRIYQHWDSNEIWWPVTNFGTPTTPTNRTQEASGFAPTAFGYALALSYTPVYGRVLGFKSTRFGRPTLPPAQTARTTGSRLTTFGTPQAGWLLTGAASGWRNTHLGSVRATWQQFVLPGGFTATHLGRPTSTHQLFGLPTGFTSTHLGLPKVRYGQFGSAMGFTISHLGEPAASARVKAIATGSRTTTLPTPVALRYRVCAATGFLTGHMGSPVAALHQSAQSFSSTAFGEPWTRFMQRASGFRPTHAGTPTLHIALSATGVHKDQRFGLPKVYRPTAYLAYGINASNRIGHPSATCHINHPAAGFTSTQLGNPACYERHRVRHMAPATRFGTPILRRTPSCDGRYVAGAIHSTRLGVPHA